MCPTAGLTFITTQKRAFSSGPSALLPLSFSTLQDPQQVPEWIPDQSPALPAPHVSDQMLTDVIVSVRERLLSGRSGTKMQVGVAISGTFLPKVSALPDHLNRLRRPLKWWMSYGSTRNSTPPLPKNTQHLYSVCVHLEACEGASQRIVASHSELRSGLARHHFCRDA